MDDYNLYLVLREYPFGSWFLGILLTAAGGLMLLSTGGMRIMALFFIGIGLLSFLTANIVTVAGDKTTRMLKLESRSMVRHISTEISFDEIIGVNIERAIRSGRGHRFYRVALLKKDGQVVPIQSQNSGGGRKKEKWVIKLREFLGIQDTNRTPSGMIPMELSKYTEIRETDGVLWKLQPLTALNALSPTGVRWISADFKTSGVFLFIAQKGESQSSSGFMASIGKLFLRQLFLAHGFQPDDAPGLEGAATVETLDPTINDLFIAYTNSTELARPLLNSATTMQLLKWAAHYPLKQFQSGGRYSQLIVLFGPNGVSVATNHLLESSQTYELISLGAALVKSQKIDFGFARSNS